MSFIRAPSMRDRERGGNASAAHEEPSREETNRCRWPSFSRKGVLKCVRCVRKILEVGSFLVLTLPVIFLLIMKATQPSFLSPSFFTFFRDLFYIAMIFFACLLCNGLLLLGSMLLEERMEVPLMPNGGEREIDTAQSRGRAERETVPERRRRDPFASRIVSEASSASRNPSARASAAAAARPPPFLEVGSETRKNSETQKYGLTQEAPPPSYEVAVRNTDELSLSPPSPTASPEDPAGLGAEAAPSLTQPMSAGAAILEPVSECPLQ